MGRVAAIDEPSQSTSGAVPRPHASAAAPPRTLRALPALGELAAPASYMARHSRSFRLAAWLLPAAERGRVARVYAWCRFTDDLGDGGAGSGARAEAALDAWLACARAAYDGRACGIALVDRVMGEMAERAIPFAYAAELVAGVRGDLRFAPYRDWDALGVYAHRVAGVVGRWLTELHGVRDAWMLDRAAALGRAMQLTNIVRDVGEDWDRGRVYLPLAALAAHGLTTDDVGAMRRGERGVDAAYRRVLEDAMAVAARDYAAAREAIPHLPGGFRRAVAVAAAVYEGIHGAVRRNGHDTLRRRATTTTARKLALAAAAVLARGGRAARAG